MDVLSNVLADSNDPMQQAIELDDLRQRLATALDTLSSNQKKAIIHRFFGNHNDQEIADILNTSPGNVRVLIFRALKKLETHMRQMNKEEHEQK